MFPRCVPSPKGRSVPAPSTGRFSSENHRKSRPRTPSRSRIPGRIVRDGPRRPPAFAAGPWVAQSKLPVKPGRSRGTVPPHPTVPAEPGEADGTEGRIRSEKISTAKVESNPLKPLRIRSNAAVPFPPAPGNTRHPPLQSGRFYGRKFSDRPGCPASESMAQHLDYSYIFKAEIGESNSPGPGVSSPAVRRLPPSPRGGTPLREDPPWTR